MLAPQHRLNFRPLPHGHVIPQRPRVTTGSARNNSSAPGRRFGTAEEKRIEHVVDQGLVPNAASFCFLPEPIEHGRIDTDSDQLA
jgi:hypothetical protein